MWIARAKYADGSEIEKRFPYTADGNYAREREEQYEIECWLLERETGSPCVWYSVDYEEE